MVALVASFFAFPAAALAQQTPTITIEASDRRVTFGKAITLSGHITPETADQTIDIVDENGATIATTTTNANGDYSVRITPRRNVSVHAEWTETPSRTIALKVRAIVDVDFDDVRLFDTTRAWGHVVPRESGTRVVVRLRRHGRVYKTRTVRTSATGRFHTEFRILRPGSFRVGAKSLDTDHLSGKDLTRDRETPLPSLSSGSESIFVKLLERRLKQLNYKTPHPNQKFNYRTSDALYAFNKVQGSPRVGYANESTWRALADPKIPHAKFRTPRYHIEVDQTKQVLYIVKKGNVIHILHVSTGAGTATHDGTYDFDSKLAGYSSHRLYYPSFFDGGRAIHGWPEVPTYNASHGCVRIPMWTAVWMFGQTEVGDLIKIYH